ncbi:MAG: tetratricopeptide repeat protein [Crocinitomicaceae bacterium]|nr:tetratricopeptide repeat protein [Crocinitomicaceae bacterium]
MLEDISGEKIKEQFKTNNKLRMTTMIVGALVVIVLGYFAYRQLVYIPANEQSKDSYWPGLNFAAADSTDAAIDELSANVNKFDGKIGGEVAQFVYGRQLMELEDFTGAISALEEVDVEDTYLSAMRIGLIADCYSEQGEYETAAVKYLDAADLQENELTTPMYLMKAALCAEKVQDFNTAIECYNRIKDDFPGAAATKQIDKYLARVSSKTAE